MPKQYTGHAIKDNKGSYLPKYVVSFACAVIKEPCPNEQRSRRDRLQCVYCISCRIVGTKATAIHKTTLRSGQAFFQYLSSLSSIRHTVWVVSHDTLRQLAVLDISSEFLSGRYDTDRPRAKRVKHDERGGSNTRSSLICLDSPPTIIGVRSSATQGRIVFVDTLNYFKLSLNGQARAAGIARNLSNNPHPTIFDYERTAARDCEIIHRTYTELIAWVKEHNLGLFRYTVAGQAMNAYRHRFMPCKILVHDNVHVKSMERAACFSGRTQVFKYGKCACPVWQLDVNGLYPFIMRECVFPRRLIEYDLAGVEGMAVIPKHAANCIACVDLRTRFPIFPFRSDCGVCYPTGEFTTVLTGAELQAAHEMKCIIRCRSWARYECVPLFVDYVTELHNLRRSYQASGNLLYDQFVKMLLNSLYGKFAQQSPVWLDDKDAPLLPPMSIVIMPHPLTGETVRYRTIGSTTQIDGGRKELPSTMVSIAAFVTSYARMYVNRLRGIASAGNVYYQGIDSLIVNAEGRDRLSDAGMIDSPTLGKLKVECVSDSAEIFGLMDYTIGDKIVRSGYSADDSFPAYYPEQVCKAKWLASLFSGQSGQGIVESVYPWNRIEKPVIHRVKPDGWAVPHHIGESASAGSVANPTLAT